MSRIVEHNETFPGNPASFIESNSTNAANTSNPIGQSENVNVNYSQVTCLTGTGVETYATWGFDCSNIPNNVTITSVSCKARCTIYNTSAMISRSVQLYNGTNTPKGNGVDYQTSTSAIQTLECGQWDRQELETCYIRVSA